MNPNRRSTPPGILEAIAGTLLPPSKREQVLGDLAERHANRFADVTWGAHILGYVLDSATTIPQVWVGVIRRELRGDVPKLAGASAATIQQRTDQLAQQIRRRGVISSLLILSFWVLRLMLQGYSPSPGLEGIINLTILVAMVLVLYLQLPVSTATSQIRHRALLPFVVTLYPPKPAGSELREYRQLLTNLLKHERNLVWPLFPSVVLAALATRLLRWWPGTPKQERLLIVLGLAALAYPLCVAVNRYRADRVQQEMEGLGPDDEWLATNEAGSKGDLA